MFKKEEYEKFIYQINTLIKKSEFYLPYSNHMAEGKNTFKLSQVFTKKNYSTEWIDVIEDAINALDTIVRNPRKFIVIEEDIVDISLAKSISVESVKHLAQHTNLISSVKKDGTIVPNKILNTSKEESFEVYENRFIYTLLLKINEFIDGRFDAIKNALMQSGELSVDIKSEFNVGGNKVTYNLDTSANIPFDEVVKPMSKTGQLSNLDRLVRIRSIMSDFLSSAFAKEMRSCALVRPPITRTNVILKDPNFKKALLLWQFVQTNENLEFKVETSKETTDLPPSLIDKYKSIIFWNTLLIESMATSRDGETSFEEVQEKEKVIADEYVTKNIDDFVPDDFPQLKMDLNEVRRIYYRIPEMKTLRLTEISKMNAALDRVLRQYKINKAKEDSALQKKLIAQQLKEEAEAKRLALKEAKDLERQKKKEEADAIKLAKRQHKEALEAEKQAKLERQQQEKEMQLEAERAAEEEARRLAEIAQEELQRQIEEEKIEAQERLRKEAEKAAARLLEQRQEYWNKEKNLSIRLLQEQNEIKLDKKQKAVLEIIKEEEQLRLQTIRKMESLLRSATVFEYNSNVERLLDEAKTFMSVEEALSIKRDVDGDKPQLSKLAASKRLEILKAQLDNIKERKEKNKTLKLLKKRNKRTKKILQKTTKDE